MHGLLFRGHNFGAPTFPVCSKFLQPAAEVSRAFRFSNIQTTVVCPEKATAGGAAPAPNAAGAAALSPSFSATLNAEQNVKLKQQVAALQEDHGKAHAQHTVERTRAATELLSSASLNIQLQQEIAALKSQDTHQLALALDQQKKLTAAAQERLTQSQALMQHVVASAQAGFVPSVSVRVANVDRVPEAARGMEGTLGRIQLPTSTQGPLPLWMCEFPTEDNAPFTCVLSQGDLEVIHLEVIRPGGQAILSAAVAPNTDRSASAQQPLQTGVVVTLQHTPQHTLPHALPYPLLSAAAPNTQTGRLQRSSSSRCSIHAATHTATHTATNSAT